MRALFYTATTVFIVFAGIVAYFSLQAPSLIGGAKIVLDIDASAMPQVEGESRASVFTPYANEKDDKADDTPQTPAVPRDNPPAQSSNAGASERSAEASSETRPAGEAAREEIPPPPPGTALAGMQQDKPLFREVAPAEPQPGDATPAQQVGKIEESLPQQSSSNADLQSPQRNAARPPAEITSDIVPSDTPTPQTATSAPAIPTLAQVEAAAAPVLPPPPVPVRRPVDIPAREDRVAAADGNFAGIQFATTEVSTTTKPARVAILLRGVGRNEQDSSQAIANLPSAVSLGFLPYAAGAEHLVSEAREKGHEIIVQLPLEPTDYPATDPGPDTLLTSLSPAENAARLDTVLNKFQGHAGVTNLMGGKMLQSKTSMKPVLEDLKARGLVYVGESNNSSAAVRQIAREVSLRYGAAQVLIDAQATPDAIDKALTRLVALARQNGSAIGMGNAIGLTIAQVQAWSQKLASQGITLVPVGALAQTPGSS